MGITTKLDCYPAEGLGGLTRGVTPLEMAGAYATLASGGVRHRPTGIEKVVFPDGKSEDLASSDGKRVLTDGQAAEVTRVLEMNVQSAPAPRPTTAAPRPARRARPTRPRTPGSSASRRTCPPRSGSATPTPASRCRGAGRHLRGARLARLHGAGARRATATTSRSPRSPLSSIRSSASTRAPAGPRRATTAAATRAPTSSGGGTTTDQSTTRATTRRRRRTRPKSQTPDQGQQESPGGSPDGGQGSPDGQ